MEYRIEHDSMSQVKVPADKLWAAQTQRSQQNFEIDVGTKTMPAEITHAFGVLKKAAAITNNALRPEKMTNEKLEAICSFNKNCAEGIKANKEKMHHNLHNSLMLVTVLNPYIVYENAAKTVKLAFKNNISLKEACVELGFLTPEKFDEVFHSEEMV